MINQKNCTILALFTSIMLAQNVHAIDLNAGDYDPAPAGTTIVNLYLHNGLYNHYYSGDQSVPGVNKLHVQTGILSIEHYMDINGMLAVPLVIQLVGNQSATVIGNSIGKDQGLGDTILAIPVWVYNNTEQHRYFVVAPFLHLPTGSYDNNRGLNTESKFWVGTGKWLSQKNQIILTYGRSIKVENGFKDDNQFNMKFMQIF